jgi:hypothetical protein
MISGMKVNNSRNYVVSKRFLRKVFDVKKNFVDALDGVFRMCFEQRLKNTLPL